MIHLLWTEGRNLWKAQFPHLLAHLPFIRPLTICMIACSMHETTLAPFRVRQLCPRKPQNPNLLVCLHARIAAAPSTTRLRSANAYEMKGCARLRVAPVVVKEEVTAAVKHP